jgi:transposase
MKKYQTEFRLKVVKSFWDGNGGDKLLTRQWPVLEEKIRIWVSHWRLHSIDGLNPKRSQYSQQFKLQVLSQQKREQILNRRQVNCLDDLNADCPHSALGPISAKLFREKRVVQ